MPRVRPDGRVRRTQEERSAATRGKLMDATIEYLVDLGYSATTTTVIAERAGVSRGAQLHHFPTKAALVAAARLPSGAARPAVAVDLLWSRFTTPLFTAWLELTVAARTDKELRKRLRSVEERLPQAVIRQAGEVLGGTGQPGVDAALDLTMGMMTGMALLRAVAPVADRGEIDRLLHRSLEAWTAVLPQMMAGR